MRRSPSSEPLSDGVEPLFSTTRRLFTTSTLEHGYSVGGLRDLALILQHDGTIGSTQSRRVMGGWGMFRMGFAPTLRPPDLPIPSYMPPWFLPTFARDF